MSKTESDLKPMRVPCVPRLTSSKTYYEGMPNQSPYEGFSPEDIIFSLKARYTPSTSFDSSTFNKRTFMQ